MKKYFEIMRKHCKVGEMFGGDPFKARKGEAASLRKVLYLAFIKLGRCKCHLCLLRYLSVKAQVLVEKGTNSLLCPKDGRCFFSRCACSEAPQIELLLKLVPPHHGTCTPDLYHLGTLIIPCRQ